MSVPKGGNVQLVHRTVSVSCVTWSQYSHLAATLNKCMEMIQFSPGLTCSITISILYYASLLTGLATRK